MGTGKAALPESAQQGSTAEGTQPPPVSVTDIMRAKGQPRAGNRETYDPYPILP
jgi:hypothetical protein